MANRPERTHQVSVVIPTRNRWRMLAVALGMALGQEGVELEVIVVDDASSDETPAQLARLDDPRVVVLRLGSREGVARARNRGIAAARGEWVAFLDDDDLWSPRKLSAQLEEAGRSSASFAYAAGVVVDQRRRVLRQVDPPSPADVGEKILAWNVIGGPSTMIARTDLLRRLGGFDETLSVQADWDLWTRLADSGRGAACHEVLVAYLKHSTNMQVVDVDQIVPEFERLVEKHRAARDELGVELDYLTFWRWVALLHLRAGRRQAGSLIFLRGAVEYRNAVNLVLAAGALLGEPMMERARAVLATGSVTQPAWLQAEA